MKAIELIGLEGSKSLRLVDVEKPKPAEQEVLIEVKAARVNYADVELSRANYPSSINYRDAISTEKMQQLIFKNQSIIGFAFPTLRPEQIRECIPGLLDLISTKKTKNVR